jgi:wyosine [tRNA(Phe)-imidazoG37] synthetase (radical SAM superfamily)
MSQTPAPSTTSTTPEPGAPRARQVELSPIHDFAAKLCQPSVIDHLREYVRWSAAWRREQAAGATLDALLERAPDHAPLSINLDVTTACNYRCDHCVDMEILNTGVRYDHDKLKDSLVELQRRGLRSVIVIGGGEPTVYPGFEDVIRHMKGIGLKVGIVTNGSGMKKVLEVADVFDEQDWVRLSLDAGSDETFQAMHKPRKAITLDEICAGIAPVKEKNPKVRLGFSFIIVWSDCEANDAKIHANVHEIVLAAERARRARFDYISFKPFLTRAERNNAEIVGLTQEEDRLAPIMAEIRRQVDQAKTLATDTFKVIESTNLKVLENGTYRNYTDQPVHCHMQYFRQVLSPLGLFNCPVYRHVDAALIGQKHAYADPPSVRETQKSTLRLIEGFNAHEECKEVTCLYNHVNWFVEDLIRNPEKLEALQPSAERNDYFL